MPILQSLPTTGVHAVQFVCIGLLTTGAHAVHCTALIWLPQVHMDVVRAALVRQDQMNCALCCNDLSQTLELCFVLQWSLRNGLIMLYDMSKQAL